MGLQDLRRAVAMIPQEPVLFQDRPWPPTLLELTFVWAWEMVSPQDLLRVLERPRSPCDLKRLQCTGDSPLQLRSLRPAQSRGNAPWGCVLRGSFTARFAVTMLLNPPRPVLL